mmetsp:Transcript_104633/g.293219  ORF Transcript_104633/g.293219 Transcript_104633/m.293219 type:complete len:506 (+) Transcript_104633:65-1582(+)
MRLRPQLWGGRPGRRGRRSDRGLRHGDAGRRAGGERLASLGEALGIGGGNGLLDDVHELVDLRGRHREWRDDPEGLAVARRQHEHAAVERLAGHGVGEALAGDGGVELAADHETKASHVGDSDGGGCLHLPHPGHELIAPCEDVLQHALLLEDVQGRERGGDGNGIAPIGAAHAADLLRRRQLRPRRHHGERVARGDALRGDEDVGHDAEVLHGPLLACAAEAGLHLVRDQQDVVLGAPLAEALHEAGGRHDVAALAEHRLDDDRRDLGGLRLLQEDQVEGLEGLLRRHAGVLVGVPRPCGARRQRPGALAAVADGGAGDGEGALRPAVVAAEEGHHGVAALRLPGEPQGALHGLGAGVREEERLDALGHQRLQAVDELQYVAAVVARLLNVDRLRSLLLHRLHHRRMAVPRGDHADPRGCVQVPLAVDGEDLGPAPLLDDELRVPLDGWKELRLLRGAPTREAAREDPGRPHRAVAVVVSGGAPTKEGLEPGGAAPTLPARASP